MLQTTTFCLKNENTKGYISDSTNSSVMIQERAEKTGSSPNFKQIVQQNPKHNTEREESKEMEY